MFKHTFITGLGIGLLLLTHSVLFASDFTFSNDHNKNNTDSQKHYQPHYAPHHPAQAIQLGPRPFYLLNEMQDSALKDELTKCSNGPFRKTDFSIGHRGAAMQFPEHTQESYEAAARMGAGIIECDVTFTKDRELVCRHSQCDLHTTTNILASPLAAKCSVPFTPALIDPLSGETLSPANAQCCTSDITLAEFRTLKGKMDASDSDAINVTQYMTATPSWRTDLYTQTGTLMSHRDSISLFQKLGVKMTPELKSADVPMPYEGDYSQADYAQQMINEYKEAEVDARQVYAQSFNINDILYWIHNEEKFGYQAVFLDGRYDDPLFDIKNSASWSPTMNELAAMNVNIIAPPLWMLLELNAANQMIPSEYAMSAKDAGLDIITWTLERSGLLRNAEAGGWYYQTINKTINNDADMLKILDVLAQDVGIRGIFSDWPATVTYYANCKEL